MHWIILCCCSFREEIAITNAVTNDLWNSINRKMYSNTWIHYCTYAISLFSCIFIQMDEIKAKDRTIFSLEKELETLTGYVQKLQLQKEALDEQLFLVKEAECNMSSPKREIPGRAGDGSEHCSSPVRSMFYFITLRFWFGPLSPLIASLPCFLGVASAYELYNTPSCGHLKAEFPFWFNRVVNSKWEMIMMMMEEKKKNR